MSGTRRPWRVFVMSIGPSFSFGSEERARAKALELTRGYHEIRLYNADAALPCWRDVYRDGQAYRETFVSTGGEWHFERTEIPA